MKKLSLLFIFFSIFHNLQAQMKDTMMNFGEIRKVAFMKKDLDEKNGDDDYSHYKRMESFWSSRLRNTDNLSPFAQSLGFSSKNSLNNCKDYCLRPYWRELAMQTQLPGGNGSISCIAFHPNYNGTTNQTIFAGALEGGAWITTNDGQSWTNLFTDKQLPQLGVFDIAVDPLNPQIIYLALGGMRNSVYYCNGVYRSMDGGHHWYGINAGLSSINKAAMAFSYEQNKLLINADPTSRDLYLSTPFGIYKTSNRWSGTPIWTKKLAGRFDNIIADKINPSKLYASGDNIFLSNDKGENWSLLSAALPTALLTAQSRSINVQMSANSHYLYAIGVGSPFSRPLYWNKGKPYTGYFLRLDLTAGASALWQQLNSVPPYDISTARLSFSVNPLNENEIFQGDVNLRKTVIPTLNPSNNVWTGIPLSHSDINDIEFSPTGNIAFLGNDGGVFKLNPTTSSTTLLNQGLGISTIYTFGSSEKDPYTFVVGLQDCGIKFYDNYQWCWQFTGDGIDGTILESGKKYFTYNSNANYNLKSCSQFTNPITPPIPASSYPAYLWGHKTYHKIPFEPDKLIHGTLEVYSGDVDVIDPTVILWKLKSNFHSFMTPPNIGYVINEMCFAPGSKDILYLIVEEWSSPNARYHIFKTTNFSSNNPQWMELPVAPQPSNFISSIAVSENDPDKIWISYGNYNNRHVAKFQNGQWSYDDACLPALPASFIVYQNGSNEGLYLATDAGVYYKDATMANWTNISNNLPNVIVNYLEINYSAKSIRAGTYGRGLFEAPLIYSGTCDGCQ